MQFPLLKTRAAVSVAPQPKVEGMVFKFCLADLKVDLQALATSVLASFKKLPDDFELHRSQQLAFLESALDMQFTDRERSRYLVQGESTAVSVAISKLSPAQVKEYAALGPVRFRRLARYMATAHAGKAAIGRLPVNSFDPQTAEKRGSQDFIGISEVDDQVATNPAILDIVKYFCEKIFAENPQAKRIDIAMHQMHVIASENRPFVTPEGIHQKGCDYTIPELVVGNINVQASNSTIYDGLNNILVYANLNEGEGIFHDDQVYWHGNSAIQPSKGAALGHRLSFGFDFYVS
ncbi:MAG: 2OG-Fe dioxygenase family protein [Cyanobacteria bacterium TGS_CYA1]|nr:2OG-Fe dioxygenase family protein [Cyanobacteria bacterium TGS_CYA1]